MPAPNKEPPDRKVVTAITTKMMTHHLVISMEIQLSHAFPVPQRPGPVQGNKLKGRLNQPFIIYITSSSNLTRSGEL